MLRIAGVVSESIVDGPGLRYVIFLQGCPHKCKGCHNPHTHDFDGGYGISIDELIKQIDSNLLLSGVTFSGGEPLCQAEKLIPLAKEVVQRGLSLVLYTGYTLEEILDSKNEHWLNLLKYVDILIDGKYIESERDLTLDFRGSRNQRVISLTKYTGGLKLNNEDQKL